MPSVRGLASMHRPSIAVGVTNGASKWSEESKYRAHIPPCGLPVCVSASVVLGIHVLLRIHNIYYWYCVWHQFYSKRQGYLPEISKWNEARRRVCFSSSCDCENNGQISTSNCLGTMCVISPISRNLYRSQPYPALTIISLACSNYRCLVTTDTICTVMKIEELGTNCQVSMCTVLLIHFRVDLTSFGSHPTCRQP